MGLGMNEVEAQNRYIRAKRRLRIAEDALVTAARRGQDLRHAGQDVHVSYLEYQEAEQDMWRYDG